MRLTFDFDLSVLEEAERMSDVLQAAEGRAGEWRQVIWLLLNEDLRVWLKYGHQFKTPDEALEAVRHAIIRHLDDYNLKVPD